MNSSNVDLDPILLKALGYFWAKSFDSTAKLKEMLDDVIENSNRHDSKESPNSIEKITSKSNNMTNEYRKKEKDVAQKRQFEKLQKDLEDMNSEISKKSHLDTPSPSGTSSSSNSLSTSKHNSPANEMLAQNSNLGKSSPMTSADDFELEMEGLACAECREMTVGSGNQLVECQECHNLYHQDCHQPPISDQEVNDPRCIWYCARCKRSLRKQAKNNTVKTPTINLVNPMDLFRDKTGNGETKIQNSVTPFKRSEMKPTVTSAAGGASMLGWAALSRKPVSLLNKKETSKHTEARTESSNLKTKEKVKVKNSKHTSSKLLENDAWAEALGAGSPSTNNSHSKTAAINSKPTSNAAANAKSGISLSSVPWLSGSNNSHSAFKPVKSSSLPSSKGAFPKASASSPLQGTGNSVKSPSSQPAETAAKRLQMTKKKAAAKVQQKRARV